METRKGFQFFAEILETIMRDTDGEEYQKIKYARESGNKLEESDIKNLVNKWIAYSKMILITYGKINLNEQEGNEKDKSAAQQLLDDYIFWLKFSKENSPRSNRKDYENFKQDIQRYKNRLVSNGDIKDKQNKQKLRKDKTEFNIEQAFKSILTRHKTTEDAFSAGFALRIALTVGNDEPLGEFFFMKREEQKNILFRSLNILRISHSEFVPNEQFEGADNVKGFQLLLMYALHNALKVMLPRKKDDIDGHLAWANSMWENQPEKISSQKLFAAIGTAKEAADILEICRKGMLEYCQKEKLKSVKTEYLKLVSFYQIPSLLSIPKKYRRRDKLLINEQGNQIRALVQGKSGIGKTLLGKAIVLTILEEKSAREGTNVLSAYAEALGISQEYFPLFLECNKLNGEERKCLTDCDFVKAALMQMYRYTKKISRKKCLEHWDSCEASLITYCIRKSKEGKVLLILDDYTKFAKNLDGTFDFHYNILSDKYPGIHTIFLSDFLVESEIRKFIDKKFEIFAIENFSIDKLNVDILCQAVRANPETVLRKIKDDLLIEAFVDTPGHFIEYAISEGIEKKDLADIISDCVKAELKMQPDASQYKEFFVQFWKICNKRGEISSQNFIFSEKLFENNYEKEFEDNLSAETFGSISTSVRENTILIEHSSEKVNSFEFKNTAYFYCLIAEHILAYMADERKEKECAGEIQDIFKHLDDREVSCVIELMLHQMVKKDYNVIQNGAEIFFRELISRMAYCHNEETLSYLCSIIDKVFQNRYWNAAFIKRGFSSNILEKTKSILEKISTPVKKNGGMKFSL